MPGTPKHEHSLDGEGPHEKPPDGEGLNAENSHDGEGPHPEETLAGSGLYDDTPGEEGDHVDGSHDDRQPTTTSAPATAEPEDAAAPASETSPLPSSMPHVEPEGVLNERGASEVSQNAPSKESAWFETDSNIVPGSNVPINSHIVYVVFPPKSEMRRFATIARRCSMSEKDFAGRVTAKTR